MTKDKRKQPRRPPTIKCAVGVACDGSAPMDGAKRIGPEKLQWECYYCRDARKRHVYPDPSLPRLGENR